MEMRKLKKQDDAVVGVISAVLVIGLIVSATAVITTSYLPQWLEQKEAIHMEEVSNQFAQLKYALDIQSAVEQKTAISSSITLGSKEIPIFGLGRTFGSLEILLDRCSLTVTNDTDTLNFSFGTIEYSSGNTYFVDQSHIYEAGSLILSQPTANILNGKPLLSVSDFTNVSFTVVNISGADGKRSVSGYGTYAVYTEFLNSESYEVINVTSIAVATNYPNAWRTVFNSSNLKYSGLTYAINDTDTGVTVEFEGSMGNLFLKVIDVSAQVAPGWIE